MVASANQDLFSAGGIAQPINASYETAQSGYLLIAGATGILGQALLNAARSRGLWAVATTRTEMTLESSESVEAALDYYQPWGVINATGWVKVDEAEENNGGCHTSNVDGAVLLAKACARRSLSSVHFSSDLVFDGLGQTPYPERALMSHLGVYGASKAQADEQLTVQPGTLVIRTAAFFSPSDIHNFATALVSSLNRGERFGASADHYISPTYVPHLATTALDLLIDRATGLWHITNGEQLSWLEFGRRLAVACGLDTAQLHSARPQKLGWIAVRPIRSGLISQRGQLLPSLDQAIPEFAQAI